jgi:hypothetical protein
MDPFETYETKIEKLEEQKADLIKACYDLCDRLHTWIEGHPDHMVLMDKAAIYAGEAAIAKSKEGD